MSDPESERAIYEHFKRLGCFDPAKETKELIEDVPALRNQGADPGQPAAGLDSHELERIRSGLAQVLDDGSSHVPQAFRDMAALLAEVDRLSAALSAPAQGPAFPERRTSFRVSMSEHHAEIITEGYTPTEYQRGQMQSAFADVVRRALARPVPAAPAGLVRENGDPFVPRAWMDAFCKIGDIMGPNDWTTCEDLIEMVRKMKAAGRERGEEGAGGLAEPPISGRWRYNNGVLCCGTIRAMRDDWDTDPADEFKAEVMGWACNVLNAAIEEYQSNGSASSSPQRAASGPRRGETPPSQHPDKWRELHEDEDLQEGDVFGDDGAEPFYDTVRGLAGMKVSGLAERVLHTTAYRPISGSALLGEAPPTKEAEQSPQEKFQCQNCEILTVRAPGFGFVCDRCWSMANEGHGRGLIPESNDHVPRGFGEIRSCANCGLLVPAKSQCKGKAKLRPMEAPGATVQPQAEGGDR